MKTEEKQAIDYENQWGKWDRVEGTLETVY